MINVIRNNRNEIISINGFQVGDYIVFIRALGGYSDCMFRIEEFWDLNGVIYIKTEESVSFANSDFFIGSQHATTQEIANYNS